ncbi:Atg39p KNAG_0J02760 [Huiozyma naganishii CBS 8797]|uniref:Uncharacterized protein n=1 Tax=Huiozyma naganishii (strain ATCC MYA-139 / BCRC 22969 / CBS 8797 / KCTC 17520 / NBRC 10181 / NCYC 3082 / Yp74L-3) TaxID=1071383 RepID=J7RBS8_HUIN7|nr:hypothetical protein KNAG_0J02760 [Kazachstania naganishii CBS 8797]CCK72355.1 hypothetical protein KNAG_0J02760 [Kazachstania naganishii CBS 8797]
MVNKARKREAWSVVGRGSGSLGDLSPSVDFTTSELSLSEFPKEEDVLSSTSSDYSNERTAASRSNVEGLEGKVTKVEEASEVANSQDTLSGVTPEDPTAAGSSFMVPTRARARCSQWTTAVTAPPEKSTPINRSGDDWVVSVKVLVVTVLVTFLTTLLLQRGYDHWLERSRVGSRGKLDMRHWQIVGGVDHWATLAHDRGLPQRASWNPTGNPTGKYYVDFDNRFICPLQEGDVVGWRRFKTVARIARHTARSKLCQLYTASKQWYEKTAAEFSGVWAQTRRYRALRSAEFKRGYHRLCHRAGTLVRRYTSTGRRYIHLHPRRTVERLRGTLSRWIPRLH